MCVCVCVVINRVASSVGFADIPMGEASPFIMRRTTAKRRSSRLSSRRTPAAADRTVTQSPLADGKVGPGTGSQLTALVLTALATHPGIQSAWMTDAETH